MKKSKNSLVQESQETLAALDEDQNPLEERLGSPQNLRNIHTQFLQNDQDSSANRAAVQELVDFVPPYDPAELASRGQGDRFNVNFGLVSAIKNEAVGSYHDIFTTPTTLLELVLQDSIESDEAAHWASIMSEEFTLMLRSWDASTPKMLLLGDLVVTHGIGIPWFEDGNNIDFEVSGMEDFCFDDDQEAISSKVEICTVEKTISSTKLFSKIDGKKVDDDGFTSSGWNKDVIIELIRKSQTEKSANDSWGYEKMQREAKGNRIVGGKNLPSVSLVWGFVRELDGQYSVYAASNHNSKSGGDDRTNYFAGMEENWVFRQRSTYKDANQAFQIFAFGVGNKNNIHTIRGLGYSLYEAGQADNVIKCKGLDAARFRASEIYQPQGGVDAEMDMQMIDMGSAMIIPPSLRAVPSSMGQPLDKTIGVAQSITREVMDRHSGGLASSPQQGSGGRQNELQVAAELDHLGKLLNFAINLYYPPLEKLLRELARRAFTETQTDLETMELVKDMKRRIVERGVPKESFQKIDLKRSKVQRVMGAGSRGTRMLIFSQMSQLFPEMDPEGKERFTFDWATEMVGNDRAERYFARPGQRRGHVDVSIARLENARMSEGDFIDPSPGENVMVHLEIHIQEGLEPGLQAVEDGSIEFDDFVLNHVTLFQHAVQTLETATVHESLLPKLNALRQRTQQIGEVIQNGLRSINADRRKAGEQPLDQNDQGQGNQEQDPAVAQQQADQQKAQTEQLQASQKIETMVAETQAKLEAMARQTEAKIATMQAQSMAKIAIMDAEAAAQMKRAQILEAAKGS